MRVQGSADDFFTELFPHGLVPQILRLIVDTWAMFQLPAEDEDEPKITNRFVLEMQRQGRRRRARFLILPHSKDVEKIQPTGKGFVEIDICIYHGYEPRCYFGIEAKKLHTTSASGKWESQAGEYVSKDGMGCFVDGRYASFQSQGAMVGYVMGADCVRAKAKISEAIDSKADELRVPVPCPLLATRRLANYPHAFETRHSLDRGAFTIFHVLLAAKQNAA